MMRTDSPSRFSPVPLSVGQHPFGRHQRWFNRDPDHLPAGSASRGRSVACPPATSIDSQDHTAWTRSGPPRNPNHHFVRCRLPAQKPNRPPTNNNASVPGSGTELVIAADQIRSQPWQLTWSVLLSDISGSWPRHVEVLDAHELRHRSQQVGIGFLMNTDWNSTQMCSRITWAARNVERSPHRRNARRRA